MACVFSTSDQSETFNIVFKFLSTSFTLAGILMVLRLTVGEVILEELRSYFSSFFRNLVICLSTNLTLVINESSDMSRDEVYDGAKIYLTTKIDPKAKRLRLSKTKGPKEFTLSIDNGEELVDIFERTQLKWRHNCLQTQEQNSAKENVFELSFNMKFKEKVLDFYLPHVLERAKQIREETRVVMIYHCDCPRGVDDIRIRGPMIFKHPATFDTVALHYPELKTRIIDDLERFLRSREFYNRVGKVWKRGYLLYGPSGPGKSSLIAAMADYLNFDIYHLKLASIYSRSDLRKVLLSTTNRSMLVIDDIDCTIQLQDSENQLESDNSNRRLTPSGITNFIDDALWSSCGDARIILFTSNHEDRLHPVLPHPGIVPVYLSYCTVDAFRILASNYLDISNGDHPLFGEIESLIQSTEVTPAEVEEELMRSEDADLALDGLVNFLIHKRSQSQQTV